MSFLILLFFLFVFVLNFEFCELLLFRATVGCMGLYHGIVCNCICRRLRCIFERKIWGKIDFPEKFGSIRVHYNTLLHIFKKNILIFQYHLLTLKVLKVRYFWVPLTTKKFIATKLLRIFKTPLNNFFSQNFYLPTLKVSRLSKQNYQSWIHPRESQMVKFWRNLLLIN